MCIEMNIFQTWRFQSSYLSIGCIFKSEYLHNIQKFIISLLGSVSDIIYHNFSSMECIVKGKIRQGRGISFYIDIYRSIFLRFHLEYFISIIFNLYSKLSHLIEGNINIWLTHKVSYYLYSQSIFEQWCDLQYSSEILRRGISFHFYKSILSFLSSFDNYRQESIICFHYNSELFHTIYEIFYRALFHSLISSNDNIPMSIQSCQRC